MHASAALEQCSRFDDCVSIPTVHVQHGSLCGALSMRHVRHVDLFVAVLHAHFGMDGGALAFGVRNHKAREGVRQPDGFRFSVRAL